MDEHEQESDPVFDNRENWRPGTFGFHELLDRERLVTNLWHSAVRDHPSVKHDPELSQRVEEIGNLMEDLYQFIGGMTPEETPSDLTV